jgi:hypothetical protein
MLYLIAYGIAGDRRGEDVAICCQAMAHAFSSACPDASCGRGVKPPRWERNYGPHRCDRGPGAHLPARRKDGSRRRGPGSAGDRGTPGLLGRLVTRYTSAPDQADGRRLAHTNTHVSGLFCGACPETLAAAGCSSEDGATDTKRPGHGRSGKASVAKLSPKTPGYLGARSSHNGAGGRAFAAIWDLRPMDCRAASRAGRSARSVMHSKPSTRRE